MNIKRKTIITIGIVTLFFGMFFMPIGATIHPIKINKNNCIEDSLVPPYVKAGDIVFFECGNYSIRAPGWDHCGLYIGNNEFIHASAYSGSVVKQNISIFETLDLEIVYGKVKTANETQIIGAIEFAESQIGKPFQSFYLKNPDPDSETWYCSELVWAAYLSQGIDIDINGWNFPRFVGTLEICWDDDVEMYTYHELNEWYPGFFISWLIHYIINNPTNHKNR